MTMKRKAIYCIPALIALCISSAHAQTTSSVSGIVVDESGQPLEGVSYMITAIEDQLKSGRWGVVFYTGTPRIETTEKDGVFTIPFHSPQRYDLQFSKPGFAPSFIYQVARDSLDLKVTMRRGQALHGVVRRVIQGTTQTVPNSNSIVMLRLSNPRGICYQEHCPTGPDGEFSFQVTAPPIGPSSVVAGRWEPIGKWRVECNRHLVEVDVRDDKPIKEVEIVDNGNGGV